MVQIKAVILASLFTLSVSASPLDKRSGATIAADMKAIGTQLSVLNGAIDKYSGGIVAGLPLQQAETPLETAINKAVTDLKAEPSPTDEAEARQVLQEVRDLEPLITTATDGIIAKAPLFGTIKSTVKGDMVRLKEGTDALADALVSKSPASLKDDAAQEKKKVEIMFDAAIKAVS